MPGLSQYLAMVIIGLLFIAGALGVSRLLKTGMDTYYGFNKGAEILLVGHSHTVVGVDAQRLEKEWSVPVEKYATAGANVLDRSWMLQHFIAQNPTVRLVVYDVDPRLFDSDGLSSASYSLFLPYMDVAPMSDYMRQEASWQEYYSGKLVRTTRFRDQTINIALRGLLGRVENKKTGSFRSEDVSGYLERQKEQPIRAEPATLQLFDDTVELVADEGIEVVLL